MFRKKIHLSVLGLDVLSDRIKNKVGKRIDFSKIRDPEVIADIGGIYALVRRNIDPIEWYAWSSNIPQVTQAWETFYQGNS
jgi:hypothetical protein